jgi:hypothetical protein
MGAMGGHGEKLAVLASKQHLVVADTTREHSPLGEVAGGNAFGEVGAARFFIIGHIFLRAFSRADLPSTLDALAARKLQHMP